MPDPDDEKPAPQVPPDKPGDEHPRSSYRDTDTDGDGDGDGERRASADKDHPDSF